MFVFIEKRKRERRDMYGYTKILGFCVLNGTFQKITREFTRLSFVIDKYNVKPG
jgi:hypothetical protein